MMKSYKLLELLQFTLGCDYLSDLKTEPYNKKAKIIFENLDLTKFSLSNVKDAILYLYSK